MTERRPGMDHDLYLFSSLPTRSPLQWPHAARLAVTVFVYLEYWELSPPELAVRDVRFRDGGDFFPDFRMYTLREYGNRVGIFRLFEALDKAELSVTVAANSSACERYPYLVEEMVARGWEFAAHGTHATRMISSRMGEAEERAYIAESIAGIEKGTGKRPSGWIGQDWGESTRTPRLVAEAGLDYIVDWPNDDQPYPLMTERPILSIPNQSEWDDVQFLWHRRMLSSRFPTVISEAIGGLHEEAEGSGRFFGLHLHPWVAGMPHHFRYVEAAINRVSATPDIWRATAGEVATWCARNSVSTRSPVLK